MTKLTIHPGKMTLDELRVVFQKSVTVALDKHAHSAIEKVSRRSIKLLLKIKQHTVLILGLVYSLTPVLPAKICNLYNALL